MRSYQTISKLLLVVLLAVGMTGCGSFATNVGNVVIGEGSGSGELISLQKESFKVDDFDKVQINVAAMVIFVTKSTTDNAEVELLVDDKIESKFTLEASIKSSKLDINVKEKEKNKSLINDTRGERKLNISLPDKVYDQLTINNNFGLVDVNDLNTKSIDITVDAGSIQLKSVVGEMKLEVNAGQIVVEGFSLENDLTAKTDAGAIRIDLNESPKSAEIKLVSEIGSVSSNLEGIDYSVNSSNKKTGTIGSNGYLIKASTSVGDIQVNAK
ncbi:MAG: DUF4097 domain-containing protein [Candidatus Pristimantibacillus lignocellulolyticus]|uniref:DUF4097 domain-containing protein n=1 Tax=Candidatus Pristimantibacillus lignocellulolyticus TaxID=2994561 RepID=A0A9J6ZL64_9BACL|nr:MAG: DUF4097 domain-containing protein [Candidatus Pristimantibacillus lignocellulolyticus]